MTIFIQEHIPSNSEMLITVHLVKKVFKDIKIMEWFPFVPYRKPIKNMSDIKRYVSESRK